METLVEVVVEVEVEVGVEFDEEMVEDSFEVVEGPLEKLSGVGLEVVAEVDEDVDELFGCFLEWRSAVTARYFLSKS